MLRTLLSSLKLIFVSSAFMIILLFPHAVKAETGNPLSAEIIQAADQRNNLAAVLDRALSSNSQQDKKQALLALGRIGDKATTLKISPFLFSRQPDIRAMAAFSLGISNDPRAHNLLLSSLKTEKHPVVIKRLLTAIGVIGDPKQAIASILPYLDHENKDIVSSACDGLTQAWTYHRDSVSIPNSTQVHRLLQLVETHSEPVITHCLYTLSRLRQDTGLFDKAQLLKVSSKLQSQPAKILALRIMGAMKSKLYLDYFSQAISADNPVSIRAEAAQSIAMLEYEDQLLPLIKQLVNDPSSHVKVNLIDKLTLTTDNEPLLAAVEPLRTDKSEWVRHRAFLALFTVQGKEMGASFLKHLNSYEFASQQLALQVLRQHQLKDNNNYLKVLAKSRHKGIKAIATRILSDEEPDAEEYVIANKSLQVKKASSLASKQLQIVTSKGPIVIQLLPSALFTSANFYQLAKSGYYDGLSFHRVIANFVAQGGDPEGTGLGGPGYSIREELYPVEHIKGTVGMATSGKDTGGSQFFFNTADNIHLNNHYTIFARVIEGMDIISHIEVGDKIFSIKELD